MLDDLDRDLVQALQVNGRATFTEIGAVLGVSTQTVARRYRRLRETAGLRVVGLPTPGLAGEEWIVRIAAAPRTAQDVAVALARRPDTSWVKLTSGGTEIFTIVHVTAGHPLLLRDVPRTPGITAVSAHLLLHRYLGGPTGWQGHGPTLGADRRARLEPLTAPGPPLPLRDADRPLLAALRRDGRASLADLAAATSWSAATAGRRLAELHGSGAIFFDVDFDAALFGGGTMALLWMSAAPAHLEATARALAGHPELAVVAATTGPTNLLAQALCPDPAALHRYLVERLSALEHVRTIETAPVLRMLKTTVPPLDRLTGAHTN
jgi:DNA-binding Lrp family transcriptional regulator